MTTPMTMKTERAQKTGELEMTEPWEYFQTKNILNKYGLPSGSFDPSDAREQGYDIFFMNIRFNRGNSSKKPLLPDATLTVAAKEKGANRNLGITYSANLFGDKTQINALCKQNSLSSPVSWTETFSNTSEAGQELVKHTRQGTVKNNRLLLDGKEPTRTKELGLYTADWCLFDAVQRLAAKKDRQKYSFDLLEEFSMVREKQFLYHRGTSEITTDNGSVTAEVYCHYGESVIPTLYYLDSHARLFLVVSTRRTIILRGEA
jgi:hypothetical protein